MRLLLAISVLSLDLPSCASQLPLARSSGASFSEEGVLLAVVNQSCQPSGHEKPARKPGLDATFGVEVGNPSRDPVTVDQTKFLLVVSDGAPVSTSTTEAVHPFTVEPGTTSRFLVRFVAGGRCSQEMQLLPNSAIEAGGRAIDIAPVRFVPAEPH